MASIKTFYAKTPFVNVKCALGEAPVWERKNHALRWVDIEKERLHHVDLIIGSSSHVVTNLDTRISHTADLPKSDHKIAFGGKYGYGIYDRETMLSRYIKKVWSEEEIRDGKQNRMRANDGAVDSRGRYWLGMMSDLPGETPTADGAVFRLDPDLTLHRMIDGVTIPNGISWSSDDRIMYFTDTPTHSVYAYDFDADTGGISNARVFFRIKDNEEGGPDGHAQDVEGCLWIAIFGGSRVVRVSPEGNVIAEIKLPTRLVTCAAFAGTSLYITTAAETEPETYPESAETGGSIFRCDVGVAGRPLNAFMHSEDSAAE